MKTFFAKKARRVALVPLALVSGSALATEPAPPPVDVSGLTSTIGSAMDSIGPVGLAVLGVLAGILVFKLIRRVM